MEDSILDIKINQIKASLITEENIMLRVKGLSMWPLLQDGQTVAVKAVSFNKIYTGDIILTYADKCVLCHRVLRRGFNHVQTKADALPGFDAKVTADQIVGKVIVKYKNNRAVNLETALQRIFAFFYAYLTLLLSPLYPFLGWMRRAIRRPTTIQ